MSGGIQTTVNTRQAPGVQGQSASNNPYSTYVAGPGGLVAGAAGVTVGNFAWVSYQAIDFDNAPTIVNSFGAGSVSGFVANTQQALISTYLADSSLIIPTGFGVTLVTSGDWYAINNASTYAQPGMQCYALLSNGAPYFLSAAPSAGTSATSTITAETNAFTGSIQGNILTVATGGITGSIYPGTVITGVGVTSGAMITKQLTGTALGAGTYSLSIGEMTVAAGTSLTGKYGLLALAGAITTAPFGVGSLIGGSTTPAGTYITQLITGDGSLTSTTTTAAVNYTGTTITSFTATGTQYVATNFYAWSGGANGEVIKMGTAAGYVGF